MNMDDCIECGHNTSFGSMKFVNRISADDGFLCAECAALTCDRCHNKIPIDEDLTPADVYGDDNPGLFSDDAYRVCEGCLTKLESNMKYLNGGE